MCNCNKPDTLHKVVESLKYKHGIREPHVHADVIKAWADGHQVEVFLGGTWQLARSPQFSEDQHYRVKPEPKPQTDLEKYGVEVGDVWINRTRGMITHIFGLDGSAGISIFYQESARPASAVRCDLHTLLFRRGVVNKL